MGCVLNVLLIVVSFSVILHGIVSLVSSTFSLPQITFLWMTLLDLPCWSPKIRRLLSQTA